MADEPRRVGRYEIVREVGRGGMALVYLARQTDLNRDVALKELAMLHAGNPAFAARFLQESQTAGSLTHPNIVTVHEYFEHDGTPYIAMEYMPRGSLRPLIGNMSLPQIAGVFEGLLSGLAYAESLQIIHRDLKPENLMLSSAGTPKITDFGIAKAVNKLSAGLTATGTTVGTPTYMAPEQAMARELSPATDLYSVGVMAYEMLVGHVPFHDTDTPVAILLRNVNDPIPPPLEANPNLDPQLAEWTERLLVKDPKQRTQSAAQAWDELEEIVIGLLGPRWRREARLFPTGEAAAVPTPPAFSPPPTPPPAPDPPAAASPPGDEFATFGPTPAIPATPVDADPVTNDAATGEPTAPPDEVFATFEPIAPPPPDPGPPDVPEADAPAEQVPPPQPPAAPPEAPPPTPVPEPPLGEPTLPPTPVPGTTGGESFQWPTAGAGERGRGLRPIVLAAIVLALVGGGAIAWLVTRAGSTPAANGPGSHTPGSGTSSGGSNGGATFYTMKPGASIRGALRSLATDGKSKVWAIVDNKRVLPIVNRALGKKPIYAPGTALLAMEYSQGFLWVYRNDGTLISIKPGSAAPNVSTGIQGKVTRRPVFAGNRVWVATDQGVSVFSLKGEHERDINLSFSPTDITANDTAVYAIGDGKIARIDAVDPEAHPPERPADNAEAVFAATDAVWVAIGGSTSAPGQVTQFNPTSLDPTPFTLPGAIGSANSIAEHLGVVWVELARQGGKAILVQFDPARRKVFGKQLPLGATSGSKFIFSDNYHTLWLKTGTGFKPITLTRPTS
jgi:serine/threonine protein kinase